MARFRHNQRQIVVTPVYQQDGLKIERIRRFDQTALLPDSEDWGAWSLRITLSGTRYISHAGRAYTLAPNTIVWHSPLREVVKTRCLPGTGSDATVLLFTARRWGQFVEQHPAFHQHNAELLEGRSTGQLVALQLAPPQLLHVLRQFVALSRSSKALAPALENYCSLLLRLIGELRFDVEIQSRDDERRRRVELAQGQMVARLARSPGLPQIAAELSVSPRQLQRDFVAVTGLTPIRYLNLVRLSEANRLLAETAIPIAEVAALLGYTSLAHFSAAFRQVYSYSPRQVREA
jgi:AraC-like DNA-binding protein